VSNGAGLQEAMKHKHQISNLRQQAHLACRLNDIPSRFIGTHAGNRVNHRPTR
jgi:hypothetical protein